MNANELIEQGKTKIATRALQEQMEHEAREREHQATLDAEMRKFMTEAVEPIRALCPEIQVGDVGEIDEHKWECDVDLVAPLCTTIKANFWLLHPYPRMDCTWKLRLFLVPLVVLDKGTDECEKPWSSKMVFWEYGNLIATEAAELDEALALASDRLVEWTQLDDEANKRNAQVKAEREAHKEQERKRAAAEQAAFKPFTYYRVTYGVVADEDGEKYAETMHFDSLREVPFTDGYWLTVQGKEFRVEHRVRTERIHVAEAGDMPSWCPRVETEWGKIRVPPVVS